MELLIAHADTATRRVVARLAGLVDEGLECIECGDGHEALELLLAEDAPQLAVVDGDLPGLDGLELCRLACQFHEGAPPYIILLAGAGHDVAAGLDAGASDCMRAPIDGDELRARIDAGRRMQTLLSRRATAGTSRAAATLVAERSPFDEDDGDDEPAGTFELQSVLVVE